MEKVMAKVMEIILSKSSGCCGCGEEAPDDGANVGHEAGEEDADDHRAAVDHQDVAQACQDQPGYQVAHLRNLR